MLPLKEIRIVSADSHYEREPLIRPFGFKGGYLTELWQTVVQLQSQGGFSRIGLGTQSVLYGDAELFADHTEKEGNSLMFSLTNHALQLVKETTFTNPVQLQEAILRELTVLGKKITGRDNLNQNFLYNSLVPVDNAAWLIYGAENNYTQMDQLIPDAYKNALSTRNSKVGIMYQISYGMPLAEVENAARKGYFVFKIKTGHPGSQDDMLKKDIERLSMIHHVLSNYRTENTADGKILYTMDANGRYEKKEYLLRYLEHAKAIGAFDQILFYEEPFNELNNENISDVGVRIAADESVFDEKSALKRIEQGYKTIVLKGIAKTLSLTMKIAGIAHEHSIPCVCSDLTVNPILVDWHKNLAARILPFPGIGMSLLETNGDMNYRNWENMKGYHPFLDNSWGTVRNGAFELNEDFYKHDGGIFDDSPHYQRFFTTRKI